MDPRTQWPARFIMATASLHVDHRTITGADICIHCNRIRSLGLCLCQRRGKLSGELVYRHWSYTVSSLSSPASSNYVIVPCEQVSKSASVNESPPQKTICLRISHTASSSELSHNLTSELTLEEGQTQEEPSSIILPGCHPINKLPVPSISTLQNEMRLSTQVTRKGMREGPSLYNMLFAHLLSRLQYFLPCGLGGRLGRAAASSPYVAKYVVVFAAPGFVCRRLNGGSFIACWLT